MPAGKLHPLMWLAHHMLSSSHRQNSPQNLSKPSDQTPSVDSKSACGVFVRAANPNLLSWTASRGADAWRNMFTYLWATWVHMKFHISPNDSLNHIFSWRKDRSLDDFIGHCIYLRFLHPTHGVKFHKANKQACEQMNMLGLLFQKHHSNVHHSCTGKVHLKHSSYPLSFLPFCPSPSVSLMLQTVRQGFQPFVVLEGTWRGQGWL